jgi:hypothetical protein
VSVQEGAHGGTMRSPMVLKGMLRKVAHLVHIEDA